jgi:hypothetical protein
LCGTSHQSGGTFISITFDTQHGVWVFNTNDGATFPPGTYPFEITVTIGQTTVPMYFDLIVIAHCFTPTLVVA